MQKLDSRRRTRGSASFKPVTDPFQPPFASRQERIAHNESWSRSLNERRAEWVSGRRRDDRLSM